MPDPGVPLIVDVSNYTRRRLADVLPAWRDLGVVGVIVQALDPPPGYPSGQTAFQIGDCLDFGMPVAWYPFWWFRAGTDYLKRQMDTLDGFAGRVQTGFLDVEDTTVRAAGAAGRATATRPPIPTAALARQARQPMPPRTATLSRAGAWDPSALVDDLAAWYAVMDTFPHRLPGSGIYSGGWYVQGYLGGTDRLADLAPYWWTSDYDGNPDPFVVVPWGGFARPATLKQHVGSTTLAGVDGVDLSVASPAFAALLQGASPDMSDPADRARIADLETALHSITDTGGEIRQALGAIRTRKLTTAKKALGALDAIDGRLGTLHDQFLGAA